MDPITWTQSHRWRIGLYGFPCQGGIDASFIRCAGLEQPTGQAAGLQAVETIPGQNRVHTP